MVTRQRLTPDDWLRAGLDAFAQFGPDGLKAEPLARALETTKGSFYWHFPDVPTFQKHVLDHWAQASGTDQSAPKDKKDAVSALKSLMESGFDTGAGAGAEAAMRAWARTDMVAAKTLAAVDAQRLEHIEMLLDMVGVTNPDIARALYAARIGAAQIATGKEEINRAAVQTLVDMVLALR